MKLTRLVLSLCPALLALVACGGADDGKTTPLDIGTDDVSAEKPASPSSSMVSDPNLTLEMLYGDVADTVEILQHSGADVASSAALTGFALAEKDTMADKSVVRTRKCEVSEKAALVSVAGEISRTFTRILPLRQIVTVIAGTIDIKRKWFYEGDSKVVECATNATHASLDWKTDLTGLRLEAAFSTVKTASRQNVGVRGTTITRSSEYSSEGMAKASWMAHEVAADGLTFKRQKRISRTGTRTHKVKNAKGVERTVKVEAGTVPDADLVVTLVRDAKNLTLKQRTVESGVRYFRRAGDGSMEATYAQLVMDFSRGRGFCKYVSGTIEYKFTKDGQTTPSAVFKIEIKDGDYTFTNVTAGVTADFELPDCGENAAEN